MTRTPRRTRKSSRHRHRYHVRLHFTNPTRNAPPTYIASSTNDEATALADLRALLHLHADSDILDAEADAVYTQDTGWTPIPRQQEDLPCVSVTPDKPASP